MNDFWKGLLITGAAPTVASIVAWRGWAVEGNYGFGLLWLLGVLLFLVCVGLGFGLSVSRSRQGKAGVLVGIDLSIVAMGTTCFGMNA